MSDGEMNDWSDDDELMTALGEAVAENEAVTERRRTDAQAAFTWRTVDAELMELLHDSSLEVGAGVRSSGATARMLAFGSDALSLELEISADAVLGQVVPGQTATVVLQRVDAEEQAVETDDSGFFRFEAVEPGLVRFLVTAAGQTLTTAWMHV